MDVSPEVRKKIESLAAEYRLAKKTLKRERKELSRSRSESKVRTQAHGILVEVAEAVQVKVHEQITGVVNDALRAVYDDPEEFRVVWGKKRGKTEARLAFFRNGKEVEDVGFGVKDVAAFGLRLAALLMRRPARRRLLVLDEPTRHLDNTGVRDNFRKLLEALVEKLGLQIVLVTHDESLVGGNVILIGRK